MGEGEVAQQWSDATTKVLHKKRDGFDCINHRGNALFSHAGKMLFKAVTIRISDHCEAGGILPKE